MQVTFRNRKIEKICTNAEVARKAYGNDMAEKIHLRIDQLIAAHSVEMMIQLHIGRCHRLTNDRDGQFALDLIQPYRLVFTLTDKIIQIVRVEEIVDYH